MNESFKTVWTSLEIIVVLNHNFPESRKIIFCLRVWQVGWFMDGRPFVDLLFGCFISSFVITNTGEHLLAVEGLGGGAKPPKCGNVKQMMHKLIIQHIAPTIFCAIL